MFIRGDGVGDAVATIAKIDVKYLRYRFSHAAVDSLMMEG